MSQTIELNFGGCLDVKITVIKTFALPKLIYPFTVLLDPPKEVLQKLNPEIFYFIRDSKSDKIKRTTL